MTQQDIKSVLDYLAARIINKEQAKQQLESLGLKDDDTVEKFLAGDMSYGDVFSHFGA